MGHHLKLYRKRFIPNETNYLKDDIILLQTDQLIITKWECLKKRADISHGVSAYVLDKNIKVSKVYNKDNEIVYWYCDIVDYSWDVSTNSLTVTDLLVDILVYEDGSVKVVDLDELSSAMEQQFIDSKLACKTLRITNQLLNEIYSDQFNEYKESILQAETAFIES